MKKIYQSKFVTAIRKHKIITLTILIVIALAGYFTYKKFFAPPASLQYVVAPARMGTLTQTVTGSGQVAAENQLDVKSEVGGTILTIPAIVGQNVTAGTLIATIDPHDALVDLQNARISLAKLIEPAKNRDIEAASTSVGTSYTTAYNTMVGLILDLPTIMTGLKDMLYSNSGYLSDQRSTSLNDSAKTYRTNAGIRYDKAEIDYTILLDQYKSVTRTSSHADINGMVSRTLELAKEVSETLKNAQNTLTFITVSQPDYYSSLGATAASNVGTWSGTINSAVSSLASSLSSIQSSEDSLTTLQEGADALDIQAQTLSLAEKERTYGKYFIRAPFDGIIGRIPVNIHDTASNGTVIATLVSPKKITTIPLNEVDAVKVVAGQKADLTFDAISGLNIRGTVVSADSVGVATQGVVTYNVKISFDEDDVRIRPGMSVDATIVTEEKTGVLLVPASAVKSQGQQKYVEVFDRSALPAVTARNRSASTTRSFRNASTTDSDANKIATTSVNARNFASTTFGNGSFGNNAQMTITSDLLPTRQIVTIGDSDDTNTEITGGITVGQVIVVRTISASTASAQSSTPTLFNSLGGGGATRGATRAVTR